jgi:hypothetical protein
LGRIIFGLAGAAAASGVAKLSGDAKVVVTFSVPIRTVINTLVNILKFIVRSCIGTKIASTERIASLSIQSNFLKNSSAGLTLSTKLNRECKSWCMMKCFTFNNAWSACDESDVNRSSISFKSHFNGSILG